MIRIISDLLIVASVLLFPVYISVIFIILAIMFFENFTESIAFGFLIDLLYSGGSIASIHFSYFFTIVMSIFYLLFFKIKTFLRISL